MFRRCSYALRRTCAGHTLMPILEKRDSSRPAAGSYGRRSRLLQSRAEVTQSWRGNFLPAGFLPSRSSLRRHDTFVGAGLVCTESWHCRLGRRPSGLKPPNTRRNRLRWKGGKLNRGPDPVDLSAHTCPFGVG